MNEVFRHLHVPPELVCEFLGVFSRVEYALKATGHVQNNNGDARADWDTFANRISDGFERIEDDDFKRAVNYLSERPPLKQVIRQGILSYEERTLDNMTSRAAHVLLSVRTVRNNLFHGGKFLPAGEVDEGRDATLVQHSLTVLKYCVDLNQEVGTHYRQ